MARREAPRAGNSTCIDCMTRHLARHPLDLFEGRRRDDGVPGAAKNTGDDARLFVIPGRERSE